MQMNLGLNMHQTNILLENGLKLLCVFLSQFIRFVLINIDLCVLFNDYFYCFMFMKLTECDYEIFFLAASFQ